MDSTDNPLDVPGEVAKVARIALDEVLLANWRPPLSSESTFAGEFIDAFMRAAGHDMARPKRIEDIEHFAELAADQLLADRELRDTLVCLLRRGISQYMEPA